MCQCQSGCGLWSGLMNLFSPLNTSCGCNQGCGCNNGNNGNSGCGCGSSTSPISTLLGGTNGTNGCGCNNGNNGNNCGCNSTEIVTYSSCGREYPDVYYMRQYALGPFSPCNTCPCGN